MIKTLVYWSAIWCVKDLYFICLRKNKTYDGVGGNLVAYMGRVSSQHLFDRYNSFTDKTKLIDIYIKTLGASTFSC